MRTLGLAADRKARKCADASGYYRVTGSYVGCAAGSCPIHEHGEMVRHAGGVKGGLDAGTARTAEVPRRQSGRLCR